MKGRLLCGLLIIATIVLWMYYKLTLLNPGLVSGFIVLATGIISHVINSAEDILAALFKIGESPKPDPKPAVAATPPAGPAGQAVWELLLLTACVCLVGCVAIHRQCDISISNAQYTGVYCPGGCTASVHYQANTDVGVMNDNSRSTNNTNK